MKIRVVWTGKTKEQFIHDGIRKYAGLLRPYAKVSITEIKEEKGKDIQRMIEKEGERIMDLRVPYVLLDEKGRNQTSSEFADFISSQISELVFVLGGPFGVSDAVKATAKDTIALSRMTFTHEMARLFLFEQLFRAFTIINKRGYHH